MNNKVSFDIKRLATQIDWPLLALLTTLMVDMVWIKPFALLFSLLWIRASNLKHSLKEIPPFYLLIIGFSLIQYFVLADFTRDYLLFFSIGMAYWIFSGLAFALIFARIKSSNSQRNHITLTSFFWLNLGVTAFQLLMTMIHSGTINPFALWDNPEFGTSTGDHLKGLFLAPCYINFMANSFFALYFLSKQKLVNSVLAVITLCLTSSNFAIILFVPTYLVVSFFSRVPKAKLAALGSMAFIVLFYGLISRSNYYYLTESIFKIEHHYDEKKIGKVDNTVSTNNLASNKEDIEYFKDNKGKVIAINQTIDFLKSDWKNFLFGAGIGNFSSLLARRQSDIQIEQKSRLFKKLPLRVSPSYRDNHYTIERHIYNMSSDWHSIQQLPSSFFNQILGEYGVLGTVLFLVFYIGYILKRSKFNLVFFPIAFLMGYYLLFDYLFEYLSIVVLFEVFFMLMILEPEKKVDVLNEK